MDLQLNVLIQSYLQNNCSVLNGNQEEVELLACLNS